MALTPYGFPQTLPPSNAFWRWFSLAGSQYVVNDVNDLKVAIKSGGTRQVTVANGWAQGGAVAVNVSGGPVDAPQMTDPPAAGSIYWLIGLMRDWTANSGAGGASIVAISGTSSRAIPTRDRNPGTKDVQPLALVKITKGSATPTEVVDLRVVAGEKGTYTIFDDLALSYLAFPGIVVYNANSRVTWQRLVNSSGTAYWQKREFDKLDSIVTQSNVVRMAPTGSYGTGGQLSVNATPGSESFYFQTPQASSSQNAPVVFNVNKDGLITVGTLPNRNITEASILKNSGVSEKANWDVGSAASGGDSYLWRSGDMIYVRVIARRTGGDIVSDSTSGAVNDFDVFKITASDYQPRFLHTCDFKYYSGSDQTFGGEGHFNTDGTFTVLSLAPNANLAKQPSGTPSLIVSTSFPAS